MVANSIPQSGKYTESYRNEETGLDEVYMYHDGNFIGVAATSANAEARLNQLAYTTLSHPQVPHPGYIYLLHFAQPLGNRANTRAMAQHYVGWAIDPEARNTEHKAGQGAAITRAAVARGISWRMYVLSEGTRETERQIKCLKAGPRLCPECGLRHPRGPLALPALAGQYTGCICASDPFDLPAPAWQMDWFEITYFRSQRPQSPVLAIANTGDCIIPF